MKFMSIYRHLTFQMWKSLTTHTILMLGLSIYPKFSKSNHVHLVPCRKCWLIKDFVCCSKREKILRIIVMIMMGFNRQFWSCLVRNELMPCGDDYREWKMNYFIIYKKINEARFYFLFSSSKIRKSWR